MADMDGVPSGVNCRVFEAVASCLVLEAKNSSERGGLSGLLKDLAFGEVTISYRASYTDYVDRPH
jgi:hypothetical protein